eukprot:TRINITY_DN4289_c0_g1_i7.p1 TRINITY_DN4289_c0_g1~~TRINITY_DN4289_c0_g1_i7.p1  ORF type:complete len:235 (+),score=31.51 TRINITY_DN4289_c0_g1_i7:61-765(+)
METEVISTSGPTIAEQSTASTTQAQPNINPIKESLVNHGRSSYYHAQPRTTDKDLELLNNQPLVATGEAPKLLKVAEESGRAPRTVEISKYEYCDDKECMKVIIDAANYADWATLTPENIDVVWGKKSFRLTVSIANSIDKWALELPDLRGEIIPEKCTWKIRKNKIWLTLWKEKIGDWWTLKGVQQKCLCFVVLFFYCSLKCECVLTSLQQGNAGGKCRKSTETVYRLSLIHI